MTETGFVVRGAPAYKITGSLPFEAVLPVGFPESEFLQRVEEIVTVAVVGALADAWREHEEGTEEDKPETEEKGPGIIPGAICECGRPLPHAECWCGDATKTEHCDPES